MAVAGPVEDTVVNEAYSANWTGVNTSEGNGVALLIPNRRGLAAAVQFDSVAWGGSTVAMECSEDGVTFLPLLDVDGSTVEATVNKRFEISTAAKYIRPASSGGTADVVNVYFTGRG